MQTQILGPCSAGNRLECPLGLLSLFLFFCSSAFFSENMQGYAIPEAVTLQLCTWKVVENGNITSVCCVCVAANSIKSRFSFIGCTSVHGVSVFSFYLQSILSSCILGWTMTMYIFFHSTKKLLKGMDTSICHKVIKQLTQESIKTKIYFFYLHFI